MIPKEYRLKHMKDFDILFKDGRFVGGKYVMCKVWKIDPTKYPKRKYTINDLKIGFVIGVKASKSAVKRNSAKRKMREVVRLLIKDERVIRGYMVSIMGKKEIIGATYNDIEIDVFNVLKRAGLLLDVKSKT